MTVLEVHVVTQGSARTMSRTSHVNVGIRGRENHVTLVSNSKIQPICTYILATKMFCSCSDQFNLIILIWLKNPLFPWNDTTTLIFSLANAIPASQQSETSSFREFYFYALTILTFLSNSICRRQSLWFVDLSTRRHVRWPWNDLQLPLPSRISRSIMSNR